MALQLALWEALFQCLTILPVKGLFLLSFPGTALCREFLGAQLQGVAESSEVASQPPLLQSKQPGVLSHSLQDMPPPCYLCSALKNVLHKSKAADSSLAQAFSTLKIIRVRHGTKDLCYEQKTSQRSKRAQQLLVPDVNTHRAPGSSM